ncbi:MAG: V-type ATP synthase subunit E [Spirochaetaceae bacterium]|jgi:V/A-type H+-transporting ATPase subunit E|nr:V-type ATP synthase subunit E [Spirochaetaceae bacterium]
MPIGKEELMDIQLQEFIEKIKKDGIEQASGEAAHIKAEAEAEAKRIVDSAAKEAASAVEKAKQDAERFEKAAMAAIGQASRNLILSFKGEIETLLNKIIVKNTQAAFSDDTLKTLIPEVVKGLSSGKETVDVILNEGQLKSLESWARGALSAEMSNGLEIKAGKNLAAGFRIALKDGSAYYDFSAPAVAEALAAYLNPRLAEIVKNEAKGN